MELVLRSENRDKLAKVIAFAKKLNISVEENPSEATLSLKKKERKELVDRILNFSATSHSSFGDAAEWQREERSDRSLPF